MKVAIVLALVACIASSTYSSPATQAVDWPELEEKAQQLCTLIQEAIREIKSIANIDNPIIGPMIGAKLEVVDERVKAVCARLLAAIAAQSLTADEARYNVTELKDILAGFQSDLQDVLPELPSEAAGRIRDILYAVYAATENLVQQIYALLSP